MLVEDTPPPDFGAPAVVRQSGAVLELTGEATPVPTLLKDLWAHRDLIPMLSAKDFNSRYRSASFGVLWSVLLPLLQGLVMAFVFGRVVRVRVGQDNFQIYVMSGTLTWAYFSGVWGQGSSSIVDQGGVAGKVYFPRLILPIVPALTNLISLAISYAVFIALMAAFGSPFHPTLALLVPAAAIAFVLAAALGAVSTMGHVYFRDVKYIVSAAITVLFYAAPILYPLASAGPRKTGINAHGWIRVIILANPGSGIIQLVHFAVFGHADGPLALALIFTAGWIAASVFLALLVFRRYDRVACDRL